MNWDIHALLLLKTTLDNTGMHLLAIDTSLSITNFIFIGILGATIGSLINVIVTRLPVILQQAAQEEAHLILNLSHKKSRESMFRPSACGACQSKIKWYYKIPIISFLQSAR